MANTKKSTKTPAKQSGTKKGNTKKPTAKRTPKGAEPTVVKKESNGKAGFVLCCALAVFFILLCFLRETTIFGEYIRPFFCGLIGEAGLVAVSLYLILAIIYWFRDRKNDKVAAKRWISAVSFFILLVVLHYFFTSDTPAERGWAEGKMWENGRNGIGTGIIGGYGFAAFEALIGSTATLCVLIPTYFLLLPLLFDSTPLRVVRAIVNSLRTAVAQTAADEIDDAVDMTPPPADKRGNRGRGGVELRVPEVEEKPSTRKKKKFTFPDTEDSDEESVTTLPEQIEINRTAKKNALPAITETAVPPIYEDGLVDAPFDNGDAPVAEFEAEGTDDTGTAAIEREDIFGMPDDTVFAQTNEPAFDATPAVSEAVAEGAPADTADDFTVMSPDDPFGLKDSEASPSEEVPAAESENAEDIELTKVEPEKVYIFPPITLLSPKEKGKTGFSPEEIRRTSERLEQTLANFNVRAKVVNTSSGPALTRYEVQPEPGVRVRTIANLHDDIALHLEADSIRMEAPIPGKAAVGIEIPNKNTNIVRLRELLEAPAFEQHASKLYCCLGVDVVGNPVYLDVAKMPHLLIAGATGMGKSVCINSLIVSLLYRARPDEVKLILIDPKKVEFADYNGIPHLLVPVVTEPKKAAGTLSWAVLEMERRFSEIQDVGARNLEEYNAITADDPEKPYIPQVVIVIDELADLMMTAPTEVENSICRLAQKARAAGMYLIIGTQRPSVDVITGLIKANVPSRIACKVASQVDSRTILDVAGAEKLLGRGDMLYNPVGVMKAIRVQGAFVEGKEVIAVCTYLKQAAQAEYNEDVMQMIEKEAQLCGEKPSKRAAEGGDDDNDTDPLEMQALEIAVESDTISTSLIQRRLSVGYARAARIIDKLERKGMVGAFDAAAKKRKVLITKEALMQMKMNNADSSATEDKPQ